MRIVNGWYEWKPNDSCLICWLDVEQIIQVIEGKVWATGVADETTVRTAKRHGSFIRRIQLT